MKECFRKNKQISQDMRIKAGTLLFADDDPGIRMLIREILVMSGYAVVEAVNGEDAIGKFVEHQDRIALLIFDVVMPGKNGREAYEEIQKIKPYIKVLFISGYTRDTVLDKWVHEGTVDYLSKPFMPNELLQKIGEVLNQ
jgi:two-component system, cell cycle sensor histidine kinase and response regulator CckA